MGAQLTFHFEVKSLHQLSARGSKSVQPGAQKLEIVKMRRLALFLFLIPFVFLEAACSSKDQKHQENSDFFTETQKLDRKIQMQKSSGSLEAFLLTVNNPNKFFADWDRPSAGVPVVQAQEFYRGKPTIIIVSFAGCKANRDGLCEAFVDFEIFKPDGKPYSQVKDQELWNGKPAIPEGKIELSVGYLTLVLKEDAQLGTYKIKAHVKDRVAGIDMWLEKIIELK